ncbi:hypothetical protein H5410_035831 [Solanum commersonii]|uniref:DUF4283 domain-containing protein n=1 Tax=Solanum commersonii TaxID=4109 RepID=A0A9J5Y3Z2_SOLCO|nr:hypothetical protein H5410_035831 [Solanum commersonii]
MENRIYFRLGGKSFDITETLMFSDTWFEWVENSRYYTRRMTLSKGALGWLCRRLREASEVRGKMFKTWRGRDVSTNIFCSLKFNKFGPFLSIITVNGQMRSVIIIPENKDNEGWLGLASRIESFINRRSLMQAGTPAVGEINHPSKRGEGSYKDALYKNRWMVQEPTISKVQGTVTASSHHDGKDLLQRCLVGSFPDCNEMPTRNDVRRWIQQTWKGVYNIQVFDMNGIQFLFEFQSRKDAQHILLGNWKRQEEETTKKNHLRWARIKVKGPIENIPREVEIQDGGLIFSLPVWVEAPARFRRSEVVELDSQEVNPMLEKETDKAANSIKQMLTSQGLGQRRERKDLVDNDMHLRNVLIQNTLSTCIEQSMWSEVSRRAIQTKSLQLYNIEKRHSKSIMSEIRETSDKTKEGEVKGNSQQSIPLSDPTPLNCDASECSKEVEGKTNQWVQDNILRLSQMFGMSFDGCSGEALTLLLKIDQRREKEGSLASSATEHKDNHIIPKELKNLIFDVKFKDGEPRSEFGDYATQLQ